MADGSGVFDTTERYYDLDEQLRQGQDSHQSRIHTALPIIAQQSNPQANTVDGNSAVKLAVLQTDGTVQWQPIPKLTMPTLNLGGGGMAITIPVQQGDEGLAIFASRSIDNWFQQGGQQTQFASRMHDLSDGFFIPGFRSQPNALPNVSPNSFQIRTQNGQCNMDFSPGGGGTFSFSTPTNPLSISGNAFNTNVQNQTHDVSGQITFNTPMTKATGKIDASGGFYQNGNPVGGTQGEQGPPGPQGPAGPQGPPGPEGADGNTVLNGTGAPPNTVGVAGDFYIDTHVETIYGPKTTTWPTPGTSMVGPQGPTGATGSQGPQGPQGATGPQGPQGSTGARGPIGPEGIDACTLSTLAFTVPAIGSTVVVDVEETSWVVVGQMVYVDTAGGGTGEAAALQVTAKTATTITLLNTNVGPAEGPPGPQGPQGVMGPQGDAGPQGPAGAAGAAGPAGPAGAQGPPGTNITVATTPPASPNPGALWWDSGGTGQLYLWFDDGNSQQWVAASSGGLLPTVQIGGYLKYVSSTQLSFAPLGGNGIIINGALYTLPSGGIAGLTNTGAYVEGVANQNLVQATLYRVYCFNNAGVLTADFSQTGHVTSTTTGNVGTETKAGDDSRTFIGLIMTAATTPGTFYDSPQYRYTRSWVNRKRMSFSPASVTSTITSTSPVVAVSALFVCFGDEALSVASTLTGYVTGTNAIAQSYLVLNGAQASQNQNVSPPGTSDWVAMTVSYAGQLATEGQNTVSASVSVSSSAASFLYYVNLSGTIG